MAKAALCVGINEYVNYPDATLKGCVNDVQQMKGVLKDFLGFADSDIVELTDRAATKDAILGELTAMVDGARKGQFDYLVFSLSSHGTQIPDVSGDEADRFDEAFCPTDLAQAGDHWDPKHVISDDELNAIFSRLPQSVLLEVYLDTCHSGDGLRGIDMLLGRRPRYLPPPTAKGCRELQDLAPRGVNRLLVRSGVVHHILWSACRSDQTSADANIDGGWHGAFTWYYCKEMRETRNALSRTDLLKKVRKDLAGHYSQVPQLEAQATVRKARVAAEVL
ncbi:MAG TPA: caspase family protein [Myxococcales bacterium]